jgi:hypothetical protein
MIFFAGIFHQNVYLFSCVIKKQLFQLPIIFPVLEVSICFDQWVNDDFVFCILYFVFCILYFELVLNQTPSQN